MDSLFQDLRYAFRALRQHPLFTIVAVVTVGLGIGANTAIFSVVNAVMLRPLAFPRPEQLVAVLATNTRTGRTTDQFSFPNFRDLRDRATTFHQVAAFRYWLFNLSGSDHPQSMLGVYVSDSLFDMLGVQPAAGRLFGAHTDSRAYPREALISNGLWQRRFGSDRTLVGRTVVIDGVATVVVGILPRGFRFPDLVPSDTPLPSRLPDLYLPVGTEAANDLDQRGNDNFWVIGRLPAGTTVAAATADLARVAGTLSHDHPDQDATLGMTAQSLHARITGDASHSLAVLFGAVALVLLIACANVGGLLLARAVEREREISIRTALGASPARLARQLLTESVLLSLGGAVLGVGLAAWGIAALRVVAPNNIPRIDEVTIDPRVLFFALGSALVTGIIFGMAPVVQQRSGRVALALRESGRTSGGSASRRVRAGLVVAEVALAVVLLTGAGLLLRSFAALAGVDPGFDGTNVMTMFTLLPPQRYPTDSSQALFLNRALERIAALPGVVTASATNTLPLSNLGNNTTVDLVDHPAAAPTDMPGVEYHLLAGPYFRTMRMQIVSGRDFNPADTRGAPLVVIINQAAARRFFPGVDAVGRQLKIMSGDRRPRTIVGVVHDVHGEALDVSTAPEVSAPFPQAPDFMVSLAVRTQGDPRTLLPAMRRALAAIDPDLGFYAERTMSDLLSSSLEVRRFNLELLGGFALLALGLAAVGLYGVIAFSVSQRTREIGIRSALGAERGRIARLVLGEGARLGAIGLGCGLVVSIAATRALRGLLFEVKTTDPLTLLGVILFLGAVVLIACYLPARRAARIDPVEALRD